MVILFLDSQSSLHYEFVRRGQILNHELCLTLLRRQQEQCEANDRTLTGTQLGLSSRQRFRAHGALYPELSKNKTPLVPQPSYNPDLSPVDFVYCSWNLRLVDKAVNLHQLRRCKTIRWSNWSIIPQNCVWNAGGGGMGTFWSPINIVRGSSMHIIFNKNLTGTYWACVICPRGFEQSSYTKVGNSPGTPCIMGGLHLYCFCWCLGPLSMWSKSASKIMFRIELALCSSHILVVKGRIIIIIIIIIIIKKQYFQVLSNPLASRPKNVVFENKKNTNLIAIVFIILISFTASSVRCEGYLSEGKTWCDVSWKCSKLFFEIEEEHLTLVKLSFRPVPV